jgi:hypothetical protein
VATHVRATVGMRSRTAQVRDQKRGSAACSTHLHEEAVHARGHARARDGGDEVAHRTGKGSEKGVGCLQHSPP